MVSNICTPSRQSQPRFLVVVAVSLLATITTACSDGGSADAGGSCPSEVVFNGTTYGQAPSKDLKIAETIGTANFTDCSDGSGSEAPLEAFAVPGADPEVAIAVKLGGDPFLYVSNDADDPCSVAFTTC
jgi:Family of unknown function (DUF6281)